MAKSLLSKLGKATATGLTALALATGIGVGKARAVSVEWDSFSDIVGGAAPGYSSTYTSNNSQLLNALGQPSLNDCSGIYFITIGDGFSPIPVGGFDMQGGNVTQSYFLDIGNPRYTANTDEEDNPNNIYDGYWNVFVNSGDGFPTYEEGVGFSGQNSEITNFSISSFTEYVNGQDGSFTFSGVDPYDPVPEPSTVSLIGVGVAAALAASRRRRNTGDSAK